MTNIFPQPAVPAGLTVQMAISLGLVPTDVQISGFSFPNSTLMSLASAGLVSLSQLYSALSVASPAVYGGS